MALAPAFSALSDSALSFPKIPPAKLAVDTSVDGVELVRERDRERVRRETGRGGGWTGGEVWTGGEKVTLGGEKVMEGGEEVTAGGEKVTEGGEKVTEGGEKVTVTGPVGRVCVGIAAIGIDSPEYS